jgi:C-terminal processing protease CtpA/Prc
LSPESQDLVVKDVTDRGSTIVYLVEVATAKQTPVAWCARDTSAPKFLPNASAIYFQSSELSESNLYIVDLVSPEVKFVEDDLDSALNPLKKPDTKPKLPAVTIQTKGIAERMRQLSTAPTFVSQATPDSKSILAFAGGAWVSINVATGASSPIASLASGFAPIQFDKNGSKLYTIGVGGTMGSVNLATMSTAPIPFSASYSLNLRKDEEALFKEIWWAMDRFYYAPDMNNRNWPGIRDKYAAIVPFANDHDDFYAMMGEMMEELNSSHLGATAPDSAPAAGAETTGLLGVDWNPARLALGEYVVSSVLRGSPAAHPQMELRVGDVVRSVNGVTPSATNPMAKLLTGSTGKRVVLQVSRGGKEVTVTIKPTSMAARTALNYDDWVLSNREFVDKISGGKIGYHHYAAMNDASQNKFLREVRTQGVGKVGFIIDVRYNGGGSTAHKALGVLIKTPWLIRTRRDAPDAKLSENLYRGDTLELPSTLLINQYSFSNAEIFAEGFKRLKVGPVIGERTAGGVIGTSAYSLWDGGSIRMPASGAYTITMENLERNGRKPDLPVIWDPNAYLNGRDVVLETAVKELLKKAKQNP